MYDSVLVPTDGSERATVALDHALGVARRCDATLHVLHVVQVDGVSDGLDEDDAIRNRLDNAGEEAVEAVVSRAREAGQEAIESAIVSGVPAAEILEYAERNDLDIVVMATEGRTGSAREMIGSVTETVVRNAPIPVLTVSS